MLRTQKEQIMLTKIVATKYLPATNTKGARIAVYWGTRKTYVPFPHEAQDPYLRAALVATGAHHLVKAVNVANSPYSAMFVWENAA